MIIYSKSSGVNDAAIGKLETPIKMIIEHESDIQSKKGGACDWLFNVERSHRFGETIIGQKEFGVFQATPEGSAYAADTVAETYRKFIEHVQFTKEFTITAEMMEDAAYGVAADAKRRAENFTRAYYKTRNKLCAYALTNATQASGTFAGATLDLTSGDGSPLFSFDHASSFNGREQCNYYYGDVLATGTEADRTYSLPLLAERLSMLCAYMRDYQDENGEPLGYTPDTIVVPGNRYKVEMMIKKVCGTPGAESLEGSGINLNYGNWNVIVLPEWIASDDRFILMSSDANRDLCGNMFFNRVPLSVSNFVDHHTGNYTWSGRCRFGVGFGSYKHAMMIVDSTKEVQGARQLA